MVLTWWALLAVLLFLGVAAFALFIVFFTLESVFGIGDPVLKSLGEAVTYLLNHDLEVEEWLIVLWVSCALWVVWQVATFASQLWRADPRWLVGIWLLPLVAIILVIGRAVALEFPVTRHTVCDQSVGDDRLRFTFFADDDTHWPQFLFVEHRTNGDDWSQTAFIHDSIHWEYAPGCQRFGSLGNNTAWFWTDYNVIVSQNGGASWFRHNMDTDEWFFGRRIRAVTFRDPQYGTMIVSAWAIEYSWQEKYLTVDGGRTWTRAE